VQARPAGSAYRLSKYIRKHRAGVAVAGVLLLLLVAFAASTWNQARRIADERDRANEERDRATRNAQRKTRAIQFLTGMFKPSKEVIASGKRISALDVLDNAARQLVAPTTEDPESQNELRSAVADAYEQLGYYYRARDVRHLPEFRTILEGNRREHSEDRMESLGAQFQLASALSSIGDFTEAESLTRDLLTRTARSTETAWLDLHGRGVLAGILSDLGRYAEAEMLLRQALPLARELDRTGGTEARFMGLLADVLAHEGKIREAETLRKNALRVSELPSSGARYRAYFEYLSASVLAVEGRRSDALDTLESALDHGLSLDFVNLSDDSDFDSLQDDPRFKALVSRCRRMNFPP